jgi:hypothetical protein
MRRKRSQSKGRTARPLWPIDYPDPSPQAEAVTLADGQAVEVRFSLVHWGYLGWLQERQGFDVVAFLAHAVGDAPQNHDKAVRGAILRLYAQREAQKLPRPPWLAPLA